MKQRYTFTRHDLDTWTAAASATSSPTPARQPPTTIPGHWLIYAFGLGALAGIGYILTVLFFLTL